MLYFAYNSNMHCDEIHECCPSAEFVTVAKLPNHRLAFSRYSKHRDCGVADEVPMQGHSVWGVVYEVAEIDFGRLDQAEGYEPGRPAVENAFVREQRHVFRDVHHHEPILAWLYLANRQPNPPLPNSVYKGLIVDGARYWHLPADYIAQLEKIESV